MSTENAKMTIPIKYKKTKKKNKNMQETDITI